MFFRGIKQKINEIREAETSRQKIVFLEGIIMAAALMVIYFTIMIVLNILRENIISPYLEPIIDIAIAIFAIYSFVNLVKWDPRAINPSVFARNTEAIYEVIDRQKAMGVPDAVCDIMKMSAGNFLDGLKQNSKREFPLKFARIIREILIKFESRKIFYYPIR